MWFSMLELSKSIAAMATGINACLEVEMDYKRAIGS